MPTTRTDQLLSLLQDAELREEATKALKSATNAAREVRALEKKLPKREKKVSKTKCKKTEQAKQQHPTAAAGSAAVEAKADAGRKKRHPLRKLVLLAVVGGIVALIVSEDARKAALDALFGAEEEFQYTPQPAASSNGAA